jgi:antitoxin component YwqK of YwqJK toxin-antitoxin module
MSRARRVLVATVVLLLASCGQTRLVTPEAPTAVQETRRSWHPGKKVRRLEEAVLVWSDGRVERHGLQRRWFASGAMRSERHFDHGQPSGTWKEWSEDGTLRSHTEHGDGAQAAPMRFYHPNGQLAGEGDGIGGVRDGRWTFWYEDGQRSHEGVFVRAIREGRWTFWHRNGERREEGEYRGGKRVGTWLRWDEEGGPVEARALEEPDPFERADGLF